MHSVIVGRRRYSDPDIVSLIRSSDEWIDPRSFVLEQARELNAEYDNADFSDPLHRLAVLASIRGFRVEAMNAAYAATDPRDAVVMPTLNGKKGTILYNPSRPPGRVAFSVAHEIVHTFFPNSMTDARYRSVCSPGKKEARELEGLCDLGASELLMPAEEFVQVTGGRIGLELVDEACAAFGSSYEATVFRLATSYPGQAIAGSLRFRRRLDEERRSRKNKNQGRLFDVGPNEHTEAEPKYRRQSFFASEQCDADEFIIRWNKSFANESCVYEAGENRQIATAIEKLPNQSSVSGRIQAIPAPYQRPESSGERPDILFLWWHWQYSDAASN